MRLGTVFPWMVAAACLIAAAASFSEIQRLKGRIGQLTRHEFHDHSDVREFIITAAVADVLDPIFVLGDSITEMAPLPRKICGRQVINAGIGGQTIREAERIAKRVIGERGAYLVALALGANDVGSSSVRSDFTALIDAVKPLAKRPPVALAVTSDPATSREIAAAAAARGIDFVTPVLPRGSLMSDYIHYRAAAYEVWVPALEAAITKECSEF